MQRAAILVSIQIIDGLQTVLKLLIDKESC